MDESRRTPGAGEPSGTNNQQPPPPAGPASQHPEMGNPQPATAVGYPVTAMGYPAPDRRGIPTPYTAYPNPSDYNQNPYMQSQPQPETYYTYQTYTTRTDKNIGPIRALLLCMIILFVFSFIGSIVTYFVARNQIPVFRVVSFSVSNFNVSNDRFSSVWDANVTMENRFHSADFHIEYVQSVVYLNEDLLAVSSVDQYVNSITISKNENGTIPAKVTVNDSKLMTPEPDDKVIEDLRNQRKNNSLFFNLKMYLWTTVKQGQWQTRHWKIGILCTDVKVEFENQDSTQGNFKGKFKDCDSLF